MYVYFTEYIKGPSERAILRDEDASTVKEGEWKKINTLKHYWIKDGALFRLIPRRDYAPPGRGEVNYIRVQPMKTMKILLFQCVVQISNNYS